MVDDYSQDDARKSFLEIVEKMGNVKAVRNEKRKGFAASLITGIDLVDGDSDYLIFTHSDNVVLSKRWIDFMIENEISNAKFGALCVGPLTQFTGPGGKMLEGPNYNFLFTKKSIFDNVGKFDPYSKCDNVGLFFGYQHKLQEIGKDLIMASPLGLLHHYGSGKISQQEKIDDVARFNELFVNRVNKYR